MKEVSRTEEIIRPDSGPLAEQKIGIIKYPMSNRLRASKLPLLIILSLLIVVIPLLILSNRHDPNNLQILSNKDFGVCTYEIITNASQAINDSNLTTLKSMEATISRLHNYKQDQNCLFILSRAAIAESNSRKAAVYIAELSQIYNAKVGYSKAFTTPTYSPQKLVEINRFVLSQQSATQDQITASTENQNKQDQKADDYANRKVK